MIEVGLEVRSMDWGRVDEKFFSWGWSKKEREGR